MICCPKAAGADASGAITARYRSDAFGAPPAAAYPRERAFPTGALLLLVLVLGVLALIAWRLKKLVTLLREEQARHEASSPVPPEGRGKGEI